MLNYSSFHLQMVQPKPKPALHGLTEKQCILELSLPATRVADFSENGA